MSARPSVSVALCTYNGAEYVAEQALSILEQTRRPTQVVLSDDASTDDTVAIVEKLWAGRTNAPELVVLRNATPLGVVGNFEQACLACTGDLIALCDQDDVWQRDKLELMVAAIEATPVRDMLFTDARLVDGAAADLGPSLFESLEIHPDDLRRIRHGNGFSVLLRRNLVTGATVLFRRGILASAVPFDRVWVHDEWLAIIAAATGTLDWMPDRLVDYRQHGGNQIGVTAPSLRYKIMRVFESRGDRYTVLQERAAHLLERLEALQAPAEVLAAARGKLLHQTRRAALPRARILRVIPIMREVASGRYGSYSSQGRLDILRDLLGRA